MTRVDRLKRRMHQTSSGDRKRSDQRLRISTRARATVPAKQGTFMVEALLLLACVVAVIAVAVGLFAQAHRASVDAELRQDACILAQSTLEEFASDPTVDFAPQTMRNLSVVCEKSVDDTEVGSLYHMRVSVWRDNEQLCVLETDRYLSGRGEQAATDSASSTKEVS